MKLIGSHVKKLLIKEIKMVTAEPLTRLGASLSLDPCDILGCACVKPALPAPAPHSRSELPRSAALRPCISVAPGWPA